MPREGSPVLVVGIDLSPDSELAAQQAIALARLHGGRVVLVHVGAEDDRVIALRDRLAAHGSAVSHLVADGDPDEILAATARDLDAALIVVGSHGRTGVRRLLLGSVAEKTVRIASTSVLVVRGAVAPDGFRRIVIGTDYSPLADAAMARALEVAAAGAKVHVVHAWHVPPVISPAVMPAMADARAALAEEVEREAAARLAAWRERTHGFDVEVVTEEAPPRAALIDRAAAMDADLIVVGSHGRRGARRLLLGSVAETTVRFASCSVLVAR